VVEDEPVIAQHLSAQLDDAGYVVTVATSPAQALAIANDRRPNIVLMDIGLGDAADGIGAAARLRQMTIPVVYLTGAGDTATFQRAKSTAPFGYILKPCDTRELEICIEIALHKHQLEQERESLIAQLQEALAKVKVLRGLLPICAYCKKVRDDDGYWTQVEDYVSKHSEATFNHGMCPPCFQRVKSELEAVTASNAATEPIAGHKLPDLAA